MSEPTKTSRRDFLKGRSAVEAIGDAVIGSPEPLSPPSSLEQSGQGYLLQIARDAMACEFEVLLDARKYPQGADFAIAALDLVQRLEDQLTVYRDTSEVMQINRRAFAEPVSVEERLFHLLARTVELHAATGGAFDITSGPLSKVWGFYRRQGRLPSDEEIANALANVGSQWLTFDHEARTIHFQKPGMEINLGAIGKGYAIDRAAQRLIDSEVKDFLIHGGNSSVLASGHRNAEAPKSQIPNPKSQIPLGWSVGLRHPLKPDVRLAEFKLVDQALGTSGSGTQFFHVQGKRYGHVLDPRTGWPADKVLSATVIAPTAEEADAVSTALFVMGLDEARSFCATRSDIAALFVTPGSRAGVIELHPINLKEDAWRALS